MGPLGEEGRWNNQPEKQEEKGRREEARQNLKKGVGSQYEGVIVYLGVLI